MLLSIQAEQLWKENANRAVSSKGSVDTTYSYVANDSSFYEISSNLVYC
jgi:hypothetical protein